MKRIILATMLILSILSANLALGAAQETFLQGKMDNGAVLILGDGSAWEVAPAHRDESADWLPGHRIKITDSKDCLFNLTKGEAVDARLIKRAP